MNDPSKAPGQIGDKMENKIIRDLMTEMVFAVNYESLATNIVEFFADLYNAELCTFWRRITTELEDKLGAEWFCLPFLILLGCSEATNL